MLHPHPHPHDRRRLLASALLALLSALPLIAATPASPQEHEHGAGQQDRASPYADQEDSGIAALSVQELRELQQGGGMGLARAAELNGYPGPKHVLELAAELELDAETGDRVAAVRAEMEAEARRLGAAIIEAERRLDRRFAHRHVDADMVRQATAEIGRLRGELRTVHLVAHLRTAALLTSAQIEAYDRLRGYVGRP